jgi:hypothetical protein
MSNDRLRLTDQKVVTHAHALLEKHLPLEAGGYTYTTDDLLNVLLGVAAIESVCADLLGTPDLETSGPTSMSNCAWKTYRI